MEESSSENELKFTDDIRNVLSQTYKWVYFLSIVGFIVVLILFILGALFGFILRNLPVNPFENVEYDISYFGLIFVWIGLILFIPVWDLFRFSVKLKRALKSNSNNQLLKAFVHLKKHYKFVGIYVIVLITLYLLFSFSGLGRII
jgi:hypothetical protein